jgi:NADP-dependent 3-hydroxy acid dehydrogenase YdfG
MIATGRGHVVSIGSNSVRYPFAKSAVYTATKAAAESLSAGLRLDLAGTGIKATHINLGLTRTDIRLAGFRGDRKKWEAHYAARPTLEPSEVADCIVWVVSRPANVEIADFRLLPAGQSGASQ